MLDRLHDTIQAVAPIFGVSGVQGAITISFQPSATAPQQAAANSALAAFDWSQAAHDAWLLVQDRSALVASLTNGPQHAKLMRALMLVLLDELNLHALKINAILTAINNGTTLAQVKTNIAAITDYPTRTKANLVTALTNTINAGEADS